MTHFYGTSQTDYFFGGDGPDQERGYGGDDGLYGGLGNDRLIGGPGDDYLEGDGGRDLLLGGAGNDYLSDTLDTPFVGEAIVSNDLMDGGAGNDFVFGSLGLDRLFGGSGDDVVASEETAPGGLVHGGAGNDVVVGLGAAVFGDAGDDDVHGWYRSFGGTGNDYVHGGGRLSGGDGNDWIAGEASSWQTEEHGGRGADTFAIAFQAGDEAPQQVTIADFHPDQGDRLDVTGYTDPWSGAQWSHGDLFATYDGGPDPSAPRDGVIDAHSFSCGAAPDGSLQLHFFEDSVTLEHVTEIHAADWNM